MAYQPHVLSPKQQLKMCSAQGGRKEFFKFAPPKREKQLQPSWPLKRESKRASAGARAWAKDEGKRMRKATRESSCGFFLCALSFSHFSLSLSLSLSISLSLSPFPFLCSLSSYTRAIYLFLCAFHRLDKNPMQRRMCHTRGRGVETGLCACPSTTMPWTTLARGSRALTWVVGKTCATAPLVVATQAWATQAVVASSWARSSKTSTSSTRTPPRQRIWRGSFCHQLLCRRAKSKQHIARCTSHPTVA